MATGIKTGGREKGTPNRLTKELRSVLKDFMYNELQALPEHLNKLEPKERIEILIKMMPYILPKIHLVTDDRGEPTDLFL